MSGAAIAAQLRPQIARLVGRGVQRWAQRANQRRRTGRRRRFGDRLARAAGGIATFAGVPKYRGRSSGGKGGGGTSIGKTILLAPSAQGTVSTSTNVGRLPVHRTEWATTLSDSVVFSKTYVPLVAGDETYYASLVALASQYQYFKFNRVQLDYEPIVGTSTQGQLAIACVPTWAAYNAINGWDQMLALPRVYVGSVWAAHSYVATPEFFNQQFDKGWEVLVPTTGSTYGDVTKTQGFLVIAVYSCAATGSLKIGRAALTYDCCLMKNKCQPVVAQSAYWKNEAACTLSATEELLSPGTGFCSITTADSGTITPDYDVTWNGKHPIIMVCQAYDAAAAVNTSSITAVTNCTVYGIFGTYSTTRAVSLAYVVPTDTGTVSVVRFTPSLTAGTFDTARIYIHEVYHSALS